MAKSIPLSRGLFAVVDNKDYKRLSRFVWSAGPNQRRPYPFRNISLNGKRKILTMHREIMGPSGKYEVDHIDGNVLNNTRGNLRICDRRTNACNVPYPRVVSKSGHKLIYLRKGLYRVQKNIDGKPVLIGSSRYLKIAIQMRDKFLIYFKKKYLSNGKRVNMRRVK